MSKTSGNLIRPQRLVKFTCLWLCCWTLACRDKEPQPLVHPGFEIAKLYSGDTWLGHVTLCLKNGDPYVYLCTKHQVTDISNEYLFALSPAKEKIFLSSPLILEDSRDLVIGHVGPKSVINVSTLHLDHELTSGTAISQWEDFQDLASGQMCLGVYAIYSDGNLLASVLRPGNTERYGESGSGIISKDQEYVCVLLGSRDLDNSDIPWITHVFQEHGLDWGSGTGLEYIYECIKYEEIDDYVSAEMGAYP